MSQFTSRDTQPNMFIPLQRDAFYLRKETISLNTRDSTPTDIGLTWKQPYQQTNSIQASSPKRHISPKRKTGEIITQIPLIGNSQVLQKQPGQLNEIGVSVKPIPEIIGYQNQITNSIGRTIREEPTKIQIDVKNALDDFEAVTLSMSPTARNASPNRTRTSSPQRIISPQRAYSPVRVVSSGQNPPAGTFSLIVLQNANQGTEVTTQSLGNNNEPGNNILPNPTHSDAVSPYSGISPRLKGQQSIKEQGNFSLSSSIIPVSFRTEDYKVSQTITALDSSPTRKIHHHNQQQSPVKHEWQKRIEEQLELFQSVSAQPEWHQPLQGKPLWHQNLMAQSQFNIQSDLQQQQQQGQQQQQQQHEVHHNSNYTRTQSLFESSQKISTQTSSSKEDNYQPKGNFQQAFFQQERSISQSTSQQNTSRSGTHTATNLPQINSSQPTTQSLIKHSSPKNHSSGQSQNKVAFDLKEIEDNESKYRENNNLNSYSIKNPQTSDWIDPDALESYLKKSFSKDQRKQLIERLSKQIQTEEDEESHHEGWTEASGQRSLGEDNQSQSSPVKLKQRTNLQIQTPILHQSYQLLRTIKSECSTGNLEKNHQNINEEHIIEGSSVGVNTPQWDGGRQFSTTLPKQSFSLDQSKNKQQNQTLEESFSSPYNHQEHIELYSEYCNKDKEEKVKKESLLENKSNLAQQVEISKESKVLLQEIYQEVQTAIQKYDGKIIESFSKGNQSNFKLNSSLIESQSSSIPSSPVIRINNKRGEQLNEKEERIKEFSSKQTNHKSQENTSQSSATHKLQGTLKQSIQQLRESLNLPKTDKKLLDQVNINRQSLEDRNNENLDSAKSTEFDEELKNIQPLRQQPKRNEKQPQQSSTFSTRRSSQPVVYGQTNHSSVSHNRRSSEATGGILIGLHQRNTDRKKGSPDDVVRISKLREDQAEVAFNSRKLEIYKSLTSNKQRKNSIIQQKPMKHSNQKIAINSNCSSQTNSKQLILSSNNNNGNISQRNSRTPSGAGVYSSFGDVQKQVLDNSLLNKQKTSIVLIQPSELYAFATSKQTNNSKNYQSVQQFQSKQPSRTVSPAEQLLRQSSIEQEVIKHSKQRADTRNLNNSQVLSDENEDFPSRRSAKVTSQTSKVENCIPSMKESSLIANYQTNRETSLDQKKRIQEKKARVQQLFNEVEDKFRRGEEQLSPSRERSSFIPVSDRQQSTERASSSPLGYPSPIPKSEAATKGDQQYHVNKFSPVQMLHHSLKQKKQAIIGDIQQLERRIEQETEQKDKNANNQNKNGIKHEQVTTDSNRGGSQVTENYVSQLQTKKNSICSIGFGESKKSSVGNILGEYSTTRKNQLDQFNVQPTNTKNTNLNNQQGITSPQQKGFSIINSEQNKKKQTIVRQDTPKIPLFKIKSGSNLNEEDQTFLQNEEDIYSINQCRSVEYHLEMIASPNRTANCSVSKSASNPKGATAAINNKKQSNQVNIKPFLDQQREKQFLKAYYTEKAENGSLNSNQASRLDEENLDKYKKLQQEFKEFVPQRQRILGQYQQQQSSTKRVSTECFERRDEKQQNNNIQRYSQSPDGLRRFEDKDKIWMEKRKNLIAKIHKPTASTTVGTEDECTFKPQINHKKSHTLLSQPSSYGIGKGLDSIYIPEKKNSPRVAQITQEKYHEYSQKNHHEEMQNTSVQQQQPIEMEFWSQSDASLHRPINDTNNTSNFGELKKEITDLLHIIADCQPPNGRTITPNQSNRQQQIQRSALSPQQNKVKSLPIKTTPNKQVKSEETLKNQLRFSYLDKMNQQRQKVNK